MFAGHTCHAGFAVWRSGLTHSAKLGSFAFDVYNDTPKDAMACGRSHSIDLTLRRKRDDYEQTR